MAIFPDSIYLGPTDMTFDGSAGAVVELAHDAAYSVSEGAFAFAFNAEDTAGNQGLFSKDSKYFGGGGNHALIYLDGSTLRARLQDGTTDVSFAVADIQAGQDYHVAVNFSASGVEFWVNGALFGTDPFVMDWTQNIEYIQWGGRGWASKAGSAGFDAPFEGTITKADISGTPLSVQQIQDHAAGVPTPNRDPDARDDSFGTLVETPVSGNLLEDNGDGADTDPDNDDMAVANEPVSGPSNGTVLIQPNGDFSYTPNSGFTGQDSFVYEIEDGEGGTASATATITVIVPGDLPETVLDQGTMSFDGSTGSVVELAHDSAYSIAEGAVSFDFTADVIAGAQGLFTKDSSKFGGDGNHLLIYLDRETLKARFQDGSDQVVIDLGGIEAGETYSVVANFFASGVEFWVNGGLVGLDPLVMDWTTNIEFIQWGGRGWSSQAGAAGFDAPLSGTIANARIFEEALTENQILGIAGQGPDPEPPTAQDDAFGTDIDNPLSGNVLADNGNGADIDPNGAGLTVNTVPVDAPDNGTLTLQTDGSFEYTSNAGFVGEDTFVYEVSNSVGTVTSTVTITVTGPGPNVDPVAVGDVVSLNGATSATFDPLGNDTDANGDPLTITDLTDPSHGTVSQNVDGSLTYTQGPTFAETDSFNYTISDGRGGESTATVTVNDPNTDPMAVDDVMSIVAGAATLDVLDNDSDPDGDPFAIASLTDPTHGTVTENTDGSLNYTAGTTFTNADSFTYTIADGRGGEATATVSVTDPNANSDPIALNDAVTLDATGSGTVDVLSNDSDPDDDPLAITSVSDPIHGTLVQLPDWSYSYTQGATFTDGDSFTYTISDGRGGEATATVNVFSQPADRIRLDSRDFIGDGTSVPQEWGDGVYVYGYDWYGDPAPVGYDTDFEEHGLGVFAGRFQQIDFVAELGDISERMEFDFDGLVQNVVLQTGMMNTNESGHIETGVWTGYDEEGSEVASGLLGPELGLLGPFVQEPGTEKSFSIPLVSDQPLARVSIAATGFDHGTSSGHMVTLNPEKWVDRTYLDLPFEQNSDFNVTALSFDRVSYGPTDPNANARPVARDDSFAAIQGVDVIGNVLDDNGNGPDTDRDADPLSVTAVTGPASGTLDLETDGSFVYAPDDGFFGSDGFEYEVSDGEGGSDTATVAITVAGDVGTPVFALGGVNTIIGTADVINLPPDPVLEIQEGTIAFSFNGAQYNSRQGLFTKDASGSVGGGNHFVSYVYKNELVVRFQNETDEFQFKIDGLVNAFEYEFAATFGAAGVQLFLDGVEVASDADFIMSWEDNVEFLQVGALGWSSDSGDDAFVSPFVGAIADVEVYDRILDETDVQTLAFVSSLDGWM